jgi:hypothetical protein
MLVEGLCILILLQPFSHTHKVDERGCQRMVGTKQHDQDHIPCLDPREPKCHADTDGMIAAAAC